MYQLIDVNETRSDELRSTRARHPVQTKGGDLAFFFGGKGGRGDLAFFFRQAAFFFGGEGERGGPRFFKKSGFFEFFGNF